MITTDHRANMTRALADLSDAHRKLHEHTVKLAAESPTRYTPPAPYVAPAGTGMEDEEP